MIAANPPGQKIFSIIRIGLTWEDARTYCRTHHTDLAMIENAQENIAMNMRSLYGYWIGLYRLPWRWSDNSSSSFTNWGSGQPDGKQNCVAETSDHKWDDVRCDSELSFFCHGALKLKKTMIRMKIETDADFSDPAIYAQILQQLGAVLTNKSSLTDFNLGLNIQSRKQTKRNEENDEENGKDVLCN
ncbi:macrophage mannose receptor 1-like [Micropterus salmoides]|uniref:macrophage mannose receptor 1-like n=1 Tax=Micropterus salmoides TaxID=27706 RepID=UPI0018ED4BC0|nr:macrophage mannose receptor 1-like [Micropterus salmoides]